jgi:hypothetical protein
MREIVLRSVESTHICRVGCVGRSAVRRSANSGRSSSAIQRVKKFVLFFRLFFWLFRRVGNCFSVQIPYRFVNFSFFSLNRNIEHFLGISVFSLKLRQKEANLCYFTRIPSPQHAGISVRVDVCSEREGGEMKTNLVQKRHSLFHVSLELGLVVHLFY